MKRTEISTAQFLLCVEQECVASVRLLFLIPQRLARRQLKTNSQPKVKINDQPASATYQETLVSKEYELISREGQSYMSPIKGLFGGYCRGKQKLYGRLDCRSALQWIAKGHYVKYRVFFATRADAEGAGYRSCKICKPQKEIMKDQLKEALWQLIEKYYNVNRKDPHLLIAKNPLRENSIDKIADEYSTMIEDLLRQITSATPEPEEPTPPDESSEPDETYIVSGDVIIVKKKEDQEEESAPIFWDDEYLDNLYQAPEDDDDGDYI